jgi:hypothetical protein
MYNCEDCNARTSDCPMLHDELWLSIAKPSAYLCWSCAERRLGRDIHMKDLRPCGLTQSYQRVADRVIAGRWFRDD